MSASVCVCACVSVCLSVLNHMRDLYHFSCMSPVTVARSNSGGVTKAQG